ncbi:putative RDD family membrane protein YckC [Spinactinospora alkalitolerans]|uniref:Putative RDD family membrane protein YckC n=1 Tax=Spinactinospora alkalitolerans TaxID=687207 RepID=A0A852TQB9_9ACTN|nr:RDD family protein [Spinactinospora alkalitolerans]NYE45022.1 putative RDD family membrane protein YckC [Spinactinospora alkalitolerans]
MARPGASSAHQLRAPSRWSTAVVGRRVAQGLLDAVLSSLLPLLSLSLFLVAPLGAGGAGEGLFAAVSLLVLLLAITAHAWYWVARPISRRGQTTGMRMTGIRVVSADGMPVTRGALLVRWLVLPVDLPLIGLLSMLLSARHQRLGDRLADTVVIRDR